MIGIYKIENIINHKKYIGKSQNIQKRFGDHRRLAFYENTIYYNYPLYKAFRKYGLENFDFSIIEECNQEVLSEREKYWISYYKAYGEQGYNQTPGGEGCPKILEQEVIDLYNSEKTIEEICEWCDASKSTIIKILHKNNLAYLSQEEKNKLQNPRSVLQYDKNGRFIKKYYSAGEAARQLGKTPGRILSACNKNGGLAYSFYWVYEKDNIDIFTVIEKYENAETTRITHITEAIKKRCSKKVNQYTLEGEYIMTFPSVAEAAKSLNITHGPIARVCREEGQISHGYRWKYTSDKYPEGKNLIINSGGGG